MTPLRSTRTVGFAIGRERVVVAGPSGARQEWTSAEGLEGLLDRAFSEARESMGGLDEISVALLPDLSAVRRVDLPPLSDADLMAHVGGRAARYVPGPETLFCAAPVTRFGAASDRWLALGYLTAVETTYRVARAHGLRVKCVAPAMAAWSRSLAALPGPRPRVLVVVSNEVDPATLHVLGIDEGEGAYRRFPHDPAGVRALIGALPHGAQVHVIGATGVGAPLAESLREVEASVTMDEGHDAATEAALRVTLLGEPWFVPETVRRARKRSELRRVAALVSAAAVLLVTTAGVHVLGLRREWRAVQSERQAIRDVVSEALEISDRVARLEGGIEAFDAVRASAPSWAATLYRLSASLPPSSYLTAVRGSADSLFVDVAASDAAQAIESLSGAGFLDDLRPLTPVRREVLEGGTTLERLTVGSRVLPRSPGPDSMAAQGPGIPGPPGEHR